MTADEERDALRAAIYGLADCDECAKDPRKLPEHVVWLEHFARRLASEPPDPIAGLPPDLAAILRDPSVIVPQDAGVFALIASWANAPSDTASAGQAEHEQGHR